MREHLWSGRYFRTKGGFILEAGMNKKGEIVYRQMTVGEDRGKVCGWIHPSFLREIPNVNS